MQPRFSLIRIVLVSLGWLAATNSASAQSGMTPLATATVGNQTLEVWTAQPVEFTKSRTARLGEFSRMFDREEMGLPVLDVLPWSSTRLMGRKNEMVLGMLLKEADGKLASEHLRFSTSYQLVDDAGEQMDYWQLGANNVAEEVCTYDWNCQLSPLVVNLPTGSQASSLKELRGVLVLSPQNTYSFSYSPAELTSKARKSSGEISIQPYSTETTPDGKKTYVFQLFVPMQQSPPARRGSGTKDTSAQQLIALATSQEALSFEIKSSIETAEGPVSSTTNGFSIIQYQGNRQMEQTVRAEIKLRDGSRASGDQSAKRNRSETLNVGGYHTAFPATSFSRMDISISQATGFSTPKQFTLEDVPLRAVYSDAELRDYVLALRAESKPPSPIMGEDAPWRTWRDKTGTFSIEAQLQSVSADEVTLKRREGQTLAVPLNKLSDEDNAYIAGQAR